MKQDNPNAFKHWISSEVIQAYAKGLKKTQASFEAKKFESLASNLSHLELKDRIRLIGDGFHDCLKGSYPDQLKALMAAAKQENISGFSLWPLTYFIEKQGLDHFENSMDALFELTQKFTGEFAVRPFLNRDLDKTLKRFLTWSKDPNHHVRRLSSEGCRPNLPWGQKVKQISENPRLTLPILENLKFDDELYVRKSVANHLNDIGRIQPDLVFRTLKKWSTQASTTQKENFLWLQKQALRNLIKQGHPEALKLIGVKKGPAKIRFQWSKAPIKEVRIGEKIELQFSVHSTTLKEQKIVIDYVVHFQKMSQKISRKIFKLKTIDLSPKEKILIRKSHSFKDVSIRKHFPGSHLIEIQINGKIIKSFKISLKPKS